VLALLDEHPLDLAIVIGGYNSSNTCNLAKICADRVQTFHIADPTCLASGLEIRHRPIGSPSTANVPEVVTRNWLPPGLVNIGLTAGASTPNSIVGAVIERIEAVSDPA
jgi:4-hydroxy-3-methylbut-2-enyl diphosphate reductase